VGVEVILHENNLLGLGEMEIAQLFEDLGVVNARAPLGEFSPTFSGANSMNKLAVPLRWYS
jgi:hypothetical protein